MIDYETNSAQTKDGKTKGSCYIRGIKDPKGDRFKFVLEKASDFCDLDAELVVAVAQEVNLMSPPVMIEESGFQKEKTNSDPLTLLEEHGCSVFMPDVAKNKLDWEYLAGYESVKRSIEDTVLLALTNGDVYDKITAITRMKNETNRPKCVLFEGPPGCGKTTSAKIISHSVNTPLVYMPLEAIMSKFYGESETRLAEIFEAA
jgi:ATP-dependent protease Clp ATPase subunit